MKTNSLYLGKNLVLILLIQVTIIFSGISQKNFTLYHLGSTTQSMYLNPGNKQNARVYMSLPLGLQSFSIVNTGFNLNNMLQERPGDDSLTINPSLAIDKMADINFLNIESYNELFGYGLKTKAGFISFNITNRFQSRFTYPKGLFQMALQGNGGENLGQRISMDGLGLDLMSFMEYGMAYNHNINDKLTVGMRFKFISGYANIQTTKSQLGLYTDPNNYNLTLDGQMAINTSNISQFYKGSNPMSTPFSSIFNFNNKGFGVDLGANYQLTPKVELNASVLDLGVIHWNSNISRYNSDEINYTFKGIDINQFMQDSTYLSEGIYDSLAQIFNYSENNEGYSTTLHTKFYLGASYQLTPILNTSFLMYNEIVASKYSVGLSVAANVKLKNWLQASLNYSVYGRSYNNLGAGLQLNLGYIQYYIMSDNLTALLAPTAAKSFQVSTGFNIVVGPKKDHKKKKKVTVDKE
jgi:hypothetical protein